MLSIETTPQVSEDYNAQRDFYIKIILYALGSNIFLEIIRSLVAETKLLQLIPGLYLMALFSAATFLVVGSDFFVQFPLELEKKKTFGVKTKLKLKTIASTRISFFSYFPLVTLAFNILVPLSLDSLNSYGESALENVWSFDDVLAIEYGLFSLFFFLSQLPLIITSFFIGEKNISGLLTIWKIFVLYSLIFAGLLTPTVDSYAQFGFALSSVSLYLLILNIMIKRTTVKLISLVSIA